MINSGLIQILKLLALKGAGRDYIDITTTALGEDMEMSQQSASRKLYNLLNLGLIEEQRFGRRISVKITSRGMDLLKKEFMDYQRIFEFSEYLEINGEVVSGLGEGKYYIMKDGYYNQIKEKLFFEPYPGTLNIRVYAKDLPKVDTLKNLPGIGIRGFVSEGRTFGSVKAFLCTINSEEGAVIIPERSHYTDIIEVISPKNLRKSLDLEDRSPVELVIYL